MKVLGVHPSHKDFRNPPLLWNLVMKIHEFIPVMKILGFHPIKAFGSPDDKHNLFTSAVART